MRSLQQAPRPLEEDKIADATQLLNAVAEDKTARIDKDRKEAAIAYRNLGAIAGLADPKRALEAYEKAIALDPDDLKSLYRAGVIQIDFGDGETQVNAKPGKPRLGASARSATNLHAAQDRRVKARQNSDNMGRGNRAIAWRRVQAYRSRRATSPAR